MTAEPPAVGRTASVATVRLTGELDRARAAELRGPLERVAPPDVVAVVIDLTDLTYLDSAGVHLLLDVHRDLRRQGYAMHLVRPRRRTPAYVLEVTEVAAGIPVHPDLETAMAALEGDPS